MHCQGRLSAAAAVLCSPFLIMARWLVDYRSPANAAGYLIAALAGMLLLAIIARTARRFLLLNAPVFLLCWLFSAYTVVYGQLPGSPIAYILESTSWEEMRGFLGIWQGGRLLLLFSSVSVVYLVLALSIPARVPLPVPSPNMRRAAIGCLAVLAGCAASSPGQFVAGVSASPVVGTFLFVTGPLSEADHMIHGPIRRKLPYNAAVTARNEVHVLIIGETARRASWSIYGYSRATTPYLKSIEHEVVFFNNAISDANVTIFAVPILLTGMGPEAFNFNAVRGSIVDLAHESGYFTAWLVGQDPSPSRLVGVQADASRYPPLSDKPVYVAYPPDEVLLPDFEQQLARHGTPLFIGMHTYGSHAPYSNRYPESFAQFGVSESLPGAPHDKRMQRQVDTYDNSTLYTDWFLGRVIERLRKLDIPVTVTYVSDHGEDLELFDNRSGHGTRDYSADEFEIPAFVWMNAAYRQAHPDKAAAVRANSSKEIRSHDFFYSLADLMGIRWPGNSPRRSFASLDFVPDVSEMYIAGGKLVASTHNPLGPRGQVAATESR